MSLFREITEARREALYQREARRRKLEPMLKSHVCAECGGVLVFSHEEDADGLINWNLVCSQDRGHEGFSKLRSLTSRYDRGEILPLHIINSIERRRRKQMVQDTEIAPEDEKALAPYYGVPALTQEQATLILKTIWPKAPEVEVFKAALICKTYALNPLMKHLYLLKFNTKGGGESWAPVLGIVATRLIASRVRPYSYLDGPRVMTADEQTAILGEVDPANLWAITTIADADGNRASGYGNYPKNKEPHGTDKGNTKINMAMIRSERAAFGRLFPGEMPADLDVIDTTYLPGPTVRRQAKGPETRVDHETGEVIEAERNAPTDVTDSERPAGPPVLRNVNDLTKAAHERYGLQPKAVYDILDVTTSVDIGDLEAAWAKVVASQGG